MSEIKIYSVTEYSDETGDVENIIYTDKQIALKHIDAFNMNSDNALDAAGLDIISIEMDAGIRNDDGEVGYSINLNRKGSNRNERQIIGTFA